MNRGGEVDTYERYIYIHGTNHEARLGEPMSAGCVLMRNLDIVELYEEVRVGDQRLDRGLRLLRERFCPWGPRRALLSRAGPISPSWTQSSAHIRA